VEKTKTFNKNTGGKKNLFQWLKNKKTVQKILAGGVRWRWGI